MNQQVNKPKKQQSDKFVWVAYSDLSTMLMLCFIMIFFSLAAMNHKTTVESTKLKKVVDSTVDKKKHILDELDKVTKNVKKMPECKDTIWNIDRNRNSVQVSFNKGNTKKQWFRIGDDKLTPSGRRCVSLFSKKWISTIYQDSLKESISQLIVEGHTDSQRIIKTGCIDKDNTDKKNFLCNLELSQKRSLNTVRAIFEDVTQDRFRGSEIFDNWNDFVNWRKQRLTATGRSFAEPIYSKNSNGIITEDQNRSRRVEFRFSIKGIIDRKAASDESI